MSSRHLSCPGCRIRVRASAPELDLLEGSCPICGVTLRAVSSASDVVGFRSFDLEALSDQELDHRPSAPGNPVDFVARRKAASVRDDLDAERWSDDGGSINREAVAKWPEAQ
jgi:hypothetical protein